MGKLVKCTHLDLSVVYCLVTTAIIDTIKLLVCVSDLLTAKLVAESICYDRPANAQLKKCDINTQTNTQP